MQPFAWTQPPKSPQPEPQDQSPDFAPIKKPWVTDQTHTSSQWWFRWYLQTAIWYFQFQECSNASPTQPALQVLKITLVNVPYHAGECHTVINPVRQKWGSTLALLLFFKTNSEKKGYSFIGKCMMIYTYNLFCFFFFLSFVKTFRCCFHTDKFERWVK